MHKAGSVSRRTLVTGAATAAGTAAALQQSSQLRSARAGRTVTLSAQPGEFSFDTGSAAVLVVDMQHDFGSKDGMMDLAGLDISQIQKAAARLHACSVPPTGRPAGCVPENGLQSGFARSGRRRLSESREAPCVRRGENGARARRTGKPHSHPGHLEHRHRSRTYTGTRRLRAVQDPFSGFYRTDLDQVLKRRGVTSLIITGCTTSVCVESTIRDAMFLDYRCVLLSDCTAEPMGMDLARTNHEASLLVLESVLGWV